MHDKKVEELNQRFAELIGQISVFHEIDTSYFVQMKEVAEEEFRELTMAVIDSGDLTSAKTQYRLVSLKLRIEILENFIAELPDESTDS